LENILRLPIFFDYNKVKKMTQKPTYEELEQRVKELEKEAVERNRAETAIREKENFLEIVFNAIQDGISVRDRDFTLTLVNRWWAKNAIRLFRKETPFAHGARPF
jgi:PAS domain-containing protein